MAAAMISERGLRRKLSLIHETPSPKKPPKKKTIPKSKTQEPNNNQSKKQSKINTGDPKLDLLSTYQPWVIQTYGDLAKTKTITLKKYSRILKTLRGEECNSTDSSKFRFWVKAKGFHLGKPPGYDAKPADSIVCRYSVLDADGCRKNPDGTEIYTGSAKDPALYIPSPPVKNSSNSDPVYRKVAIVENFFDIIYTVHVELEGRPGKHAGQKRTYRTITETYAFLPREAVTRFLMGCTECQRRPRSMSPISVLPTPSLSPTPNSYSAVPKSIELFKNGTDGYSSRNWESEIDASQTVTRTFEEPDDNCMDLSSKHDEAVSSPTSFKGIKPVEDAEQVNTESSIIDVENEDGDSKDKTEIDEIKPKPYNPLDVCNLTSKDPPKSRSTPKKRTLNHLYNPNELVSGQNYSKRWSPYVDSYCGRYEEEIDYNVPITTTYLKRMKSLGYSFGSGLKLETMDTITPEPTDMNDEDQYSGSILKDAEKLKLMLLAWNCHTQTQGRNGDLVESTAARLAAVANSDNMADLWASYHSALGLAGNKTTTPAPLKSQAPTPPVVSREQASPILVSGAASAMDTSAHDETSSSAGGTAKDDDDAMLGDDDDDSDDRVDPQHHDPERLKAFNMFVRLFVDENLDRIVPISKQPKEKIQAIIDSCTRQFPEFAERARKRIRTYLKSCRRNKKVRGEAAPPSTGSGAIGAGTAWDAAVRPTPAHLTSIQAEQILAQACENESHNAKRMRLGLEPVSQSMPSLPGTIITDTTASTAQAHPLLSLYTTTTSTSNSHNPGSSPTPSSKIGDHITNSINATIENGISLLNNNSIVKGQNDAGGGGGSKTASPASSPVPLPLYRQNFPQGFGTQTFGRLSHSNATTSSISTTSHSTSTNHQLSSHRDSTSTTNALLSTLGVIGGAAAVNNTGVNAAAVAAYQNALFSAMAAGGHGLAGFAGLGATGLPTITGTVPTDLSMKNASTSTSLPSSLHLNSSLGSIPSSATLNHLGAGTLANPFTSSAQSVSVGSTKPLLLPHKLSNAEIAAVRQLITGYRESAAFLLRSADELESLLMQQP